MLLLQLRLRSLFNPATFSPSGLQAELAMMWASSRFLSGVRSNSVQLLNIIHRYSSLVSWRISSMEESEVISLHLSRFREVKYRMPSMFEIPVSELMSNSPS